MGCRAAFSGAAGKSLTKGFSLWFQLHGESIAHTFHSLWLHGSQAFGQVELPESNLSTTIADVRLFIDTWKTTGVEMNPAVFFAENDSFCL